MEQITGSTLKFKYTNTKGEESTRNVLILSQDDSFICGLDLDRLESEISKEEKDRAVECVKSYYDNLKKLEENKEPLPDKSAKVEYPGYSKSWDVAYRKFKKSGISALKGAPLDLGVLGKK